MNDLWLFLGCILFLFVLWVYSGGPNNPISFAGPYITPVTAPGVTQAGYSDGSANQFFRSQQSSYGASQVLDSARSPYAGQVIIGYSAPRTSDESSEYILIHLEGNSNVDVTGWQLVGAARGIHVQIPEGQRGNSSSKRDILLTPDYRDAYVVTGFRASDALKNLYGYSSEWRAFLDDNQDIWQNDSDTITLLDENGKVVDQYRY